MTDQVDMHEDYGDSANSLLSGLRRVLMAAIGAVALTQEQIDALVAYLSTLQ